MIFVTVGSMLPFDRFIQTVDKWAATHPDEEVFAQIGQGAYEPLHMQFSHMLTPSEFRRRVEQANLIIAHAGMGSVIMAAEAGKPIVLFPRRASLGEHTTEHQLHTAGWLKERPGIFVASDEAELDAKISEARSATLAGATMESTAPAGFVAKLRQAIVG